MTQDTLGSRFLRTARREWSSFRMARFEGPDADTRPRPRGQHLSAAEPDALAAIIFSRGSTGVPTGVMLTHANVLANIDAAPELFKLTSADVVLGVLPFFHSFGFTVTLWRPLVVGFGAAYHPTRPTRR